MTKPLFTITFTQEQAIDFIKQQIKDNYSSLDEFDVVIKNDADVVIQQKTTPDDNLENPWLIPDADGWFTHNPEWKSGSAPPHIDRNKTISIMSHDGRIRSEFCTTYADWSQENNCNDIKKWKYAE